MKILLFLFISFQAVAADYCVQLFRDRRTTTTLEKAFSDKVKYVKKLKRDGFNNSYVSRWVVKEEKYQGPYAKSGEMVVVGVKSEQANEWMEKIGKKTIGLMVNGLPENNPGTAILRVGERLYTYNSIQRGGIFTFAVEALKFNRLTESTFYVTPREMQEIHRFLKARMAREIVAKEDVGRSVKKGDVLEPTFDSEKITLTEESCAGACTSPFNPMWLKHFDHPEVLLNMVKRLDIEASHVAKHLIWRHARNPMLASITLFGIGKSDLELDTGLIENNKWGRLRGQPVYAIVPDVSKTSKTLWSERLTLDEWLETIGE